MKTSHRRSASYWGKRMIAAAALIVLFQTAQLVMTALGSPADRLTVIVQASSLIVLGLLLIFMQRELTGRQSHLEAWGNALNRRHLLLDQREKYVQDQEESITWWKGQLL